MKELIMFRCEVCGNLICMAEFSGVTPECCGQPMTRLEVNTNDGAVEKHLPKITRDDVRVHAAVGEVLHPMMESHNISWIVLLTNRGFYGHCLRIGEAPTAEFTLAPDETPRAAYALCNLHGLWRTDIK